MIPVYPLVTERDGVTLLGVKGSGGLYVHLAVPHRVPVMFYLWVHGTMSEARSIPKELRGRPPAATVGEAALLGHHLGIRCQTCRHVAVILPAVMAKLVGLDCGLNKLARQMKCTQCDGSRVMVRAVEPGRGE